jgi:hypothetical protein
MMRTVTLAWGASVALAAAASFAAAKAKPGAVTLIRIDALTKTNPATALVLPAPGAVALPGQTNQGPNRRFFLMLPKGARPDVQRAPVVKELKPGIYETLPYTARVIVPPPCGDEERGVIAPGNVDPAMPMLRPELRFVPHDAGR